MNTKKKWTKSISVTLLVALASVVTTGLVLADHYPPVGDVAVSSLISFEQYQAAIDHMEEDRVAAVSTLSVSKVNSFVPYLDEFDQMELDRKFALTSVDTRSRETFEQYLDAFDQMEREKNAVLVASQTGDSDDSTLRWEQYLMYAK